MTGQTNIGGIVSIAVQSTATVPEPHNTDLGASSFGALVFQEIPNVGQLGDTGSEQNVVTYNTWGRLSKHQKGFAQGSQAPFECLDPTTASDGLTALKAAADIDDTNEFAFKVEWPDGIIEYFRALVVGKTYGKGGGEDFRVFRATLAINQESIFT